MLPPSDIIELEMSVGEGMKMIISGRGLWSRPGRFRRTAGPSPSKRTMPATTLLAEAFVLSKRATLQPTAGCR